MAMLNYLLIMTVLNDDEFEAAIALSPANNCYYYFLYGDKAQFVRWPKMMS